MQCSGNFILKIGPAYDDVLWKKKKKKKKNVVAKTDDIAIICSNGHISRVE